MNIYQGHTVLLGVSMFALLGLHFDLPPLDEFKGKNEIVSTVIIPYLPAVTLSIISSPSLIRAFASCLNILQLLSY